MNDKLREALVIANALQNAITEELAASKQEPQAQAGPEVVAIADGTFNCVAPLGMPLITLQSHREAIAKKDAALKAQNEALETAEALLTSMGMQSSDAYKEIDAAITQAEEARK